MEYMGENPDSKDRSLETIDFIINVLRQHEQHLDRSIDQLATVAEQIGNTDELNNKMATVEEKINNLQKEVTNLIGYLSKAPEKTFPTMVKEQEPPVQGEQSVILRCKQWADFQVLAMNAQTLFFCYKEDEKIFQADALSGNKLIIYTGALPTFSMIMKIWVSHQFNITEQNVLEGFLDKPK
jgi:uncharacterized coiled-coil protein SlyX